MRVLYLCDPVRSMDAQQKAQYADADIITFCENERWLDKAQTAFSQRRYAAVAAEGYACAIALALAVQLPVDRLIMKNCAVFKKSIYKNVPVQLRRIAAYARRNTALAAAEICLADTDKAEIQKIRRAISRHANVKIWEKWPFFSQN